MKVTLLSSEIVVKEFEVPFESDAGTTVKVWLAISKLWKECCALRDQRDTTARFSFIVQHPSNVSDVGADAVLFLNAQEFLKTVQYFLNAYIPVTIGAASLKRIFDSESCLTTAQLMEHAMEDGKLAGYPVYKHGIFGFHFFSGKEWSFYTNAKIANIGYMTPKEIMDYSQIIKAMRECPAGARPMCWLNHDVINTWIEAYGSDITYVQAQLYISSFIITAALNTDEEIGDKMITQLWDGFDAFVSDNDIDALNTLYKSAEELLTHRVIPTEGESDD